MKRILLYLIILIMAMSCETDMESSDKKVPALLSYTPDCATIMGTINLEDSNATYVFQHDIAEEFQRQEIEVYVQFEIEKEPVMLTAECTQADVIRITKLEIRP